MSNVENAGWDVTMLLCDAAESIGGKLYILGGGWSVVLRPGTPTNMALAIKLSVPWHETNRPINIRAQLMNEDGGAVENAEGEVIFAEGQMELGRPAGIHPGSSLDAPIVLNFGGVSLPAGGYVWQLFVDGEPRARTSFRVQQGL